VRTHQLILLALVIAEMAVFALVGRNFASADAVALVLRSLVEVGLLALALTPVIVTGGIDLSVGSLMGLCAVLLGMAWRDAYLPVWLAAVVAIAAGGLGGALNAVVITRLHIPPLIVTLGTYSLYRGLAFGLTGGKEIYTGFPTSFTVLGTGDVFSVPAQVLLFAVVAVFFWLLVQRSVIGRGLSAIGYSPDGARHAGLPVDRWTALTYILSGTAAGLAAVVSVARFNQAKADVGTGDELTAITAVVLGGTSIFGGRGSVAGTLLGLLAIAVLERGLRLAGLSQNVAGMATGGLLLVTIVADRALSRPRVPHTPSEGEFDVKNSQVAVICGAILAGAVVIAGSNWYLIKSLPGANSGASPRVADATLPAAKPITIAMMPKSLGNSYFIACRRGAEEAAKELGVTLLWDGPTDPNPNKQSQIVEDWIVRGVDVIAVAVENRDNLSAALQKARAKGIKVLTWDADAGTNDRDFFVNQATPQGIGYTLMDQAARVLGDKGEFAIITGTLTAANLNEWRKYVEERRAAKYPDIKLTIMRPCDDVQDKAYEEAKTILNAHAQVKLIMAICSPAVPGAAEAVKQLGRKDVKVVGLGLPNDNKRYVHDGITEAVILWNTMDLGYLTVRAATAVHEGTLKPGATSFAAGRLKTVEIKGDNVLLGQPFIFTKENIDTFDF
jgi:rhamnose transport system permease protein